MDGRIVGWMDGTNALGASTFASSTTHTHNDAQLFAIPTMGLSALIKSEKNADQEEGSQLSNPLCLIRTAEEKVSLPIPFLSSFVFFFSCFFGQEK